MEKLKQHKGKLIGSSAVAVAIIVFFWNLGVSKSDLQSLPGLLTRTNTIEQWIAQHEEDEKELTLAFKENRAEMIEMGKTITRSAALMESQEKMIDEMRSDIKELLRR